MLLLVGCLTCQPHASVSQGRICLTCQPHASVSQGRICLTSQQHASVSQGRICLTSQQHASVSQGRICLTSQQHASVSQGRICLTCQQHASVSQGRIYSNNFTCCHTEIEAADQTFHLNRSHDTDTGSTSPSADPITPGVWQGPTGVPILKSLVRLGPEKSRRKRNSNPGSSTVETDALTLGQLGGRRPRN